MRALTLDERRWQAVMTRDSRASDFVYAVATTGVYCRAGCASRRLHRANVRFFAAPSEARRAGYRPCRRCNPDKAQSDGHMLTLVFKACRLLDGEDGVPSLTALASVLSVTPHQLHRAFKAALGITPKQYAAAKRRTRLRDTLSERSSSVTAALFDAGYNSLSRAYTETEKTLGMRPKRYRAGGQGERIGYAVVTSSLGLMLIAATERGVCAVEFGISEEALVKALRARLPNAVLERTETMARWVKAVLAAVDDAKPAPAIPLDIRGTVFQQKVWAALRTLPPGATATYTEVARRIGRPAAVRAVASACAANAIGVLVPCHRVVRSDGGLGGYRWGLKRKTALLAREAAVRTGTRKVD